MKPKVCVITTLPYQVNVFLSEHIDALLSRADVTVLTNGDRAELAPAIRDRVGHRRIGIARPIKPWADLRALAQLCDFMLRERPDLVQTMTPKAGLLGITAATLAGVRARIHWFTGQVWQTATGPMRLALRTADRTTAALSTGALVDSPSQRAYLIREGIADHAKLTVLAKGSVRGVSTGRFRPDAGCRVSVREALGLREPDQLALFVGRLTGDKGLIELASAMRSLREDLPNLHVALLGFEEGDFIRSMTAHAGAARDRIHLLGFSDRPEHFMAAADFLLLPSYREGFGSTVIEAAACGIPAIGTRVHGLVDAIVEDETGLLVEARDPAALAVAMRRLATDHDLRRELGAAARTRALRDFETSVLTQALLDYYSTALEGRLQ